MRIKNLVLAAAIGGPLAFGLSACGSSTETAPTPTASASSETVMPVETTEAPAVDVADAETITVAPGGYFNVPQPEGLLKAVTSGSGSFEDLKYERTYDAEIVTPIAPQDLPSDLSTLDIVSPKEGGAEGAVVWQAKKDASGTTNIGISFVDPETGEKKATSLVVVIK